MGSIGPDVCFRKRKEMRKLPLTVREAPLLLETEKKDPSCLREKGKEEMLKEEHHGKVKICVCVQY